MNEIYLNFAILRCMYENTVNSLLSKCLRKRTSTDNLGGIKTHELMLISADVLTHSIDHSKHTVLHTHVDVKQKSNQLFII